MRIANLIQVFRASSASTGVVLPGRVTVHLVAARVRLDEVVDDAGRQVEVGVADQQAVVRVEGARVRRRRAAGHRRRQRPGAGDVADVERRSPGSRRAAPSSSGSAARRGRCGLKLPAREIGLARARAEGPDHAVGPALEVAAGAVLPALRRQALVGGDGGVPAGRSKWPRLEKNISAPTATFSASEPGGGRVGRPDHLDHPVLLEVDHRDVAARRGSRRRRTAPLAVMTMPCGFLPALSPLVAGSAGSLRSM